MKSLNWPFIKLVLCFMAGVVAGFYFPISFPRAFLIIGIIFCLFLLVYGLTRNQMWQGFSFGICAYALSVAIGIFTAVFHSANSRPDHYIHKLHQKNKRFLIYGKITQTLNPTAYYDKYILEIQQLDQQETTGKILLNIRKDTACASLEIDDRIVAKTELSLINKPKNPHQFNYKRYMSRRQVFRQIRVSAAEIRIFPSLNTSILGHAEKIRDAMVISLRKNGFSEKQLAMVQALLLGQTQGISDEIYDQYAAAGVIHILSVSGLHVGFILAMLNFLLKPLERIRCYGKPLKIVLLIVLLWGFALLAGFSSPVVRSVAMFSFVAMGLNWERKTHIINVLFMSLFAILLFAPRFIFDIGFQLSYLAVFSIVLFYPKFFRLYRPKIFVDKFIWGTLCVTMAAQIGVLPLSLFYFHQFPGIFFISNLVVVPYVGILLGACIVTIFLAAIGWLPGFLVWLLGKGIDLLNAFVAWCSEQENFLFQNIHFSALQMMTGYLLLFCLVLVLWKFSYRKLIACLIACLLFSGVFIYKKMQTEQTNMVVIFHKNRKSMLGFKKGKHLALHHNVWIKNTAEEYAVKNFMIGEAINRFTTNSIQNIYRPKNHWLLVVDSAGIYQLPELQDSFVLLRDSPRINLERLIKLLCPQQIIADGSNYHSYVDRWRKTCKRENIPFHHTGKKGAFVMKID